MYYLLSSLSFILSIINQSTNQSMIIIIIIIITIITIVNRPEFEGEPSHHPVDGRSYLHFPHKTYFFRQGVSYIMIFILIIIVLIVIIGLFVIRIILENRFTFNGIALGPILVGLIMAVQIQVLNLLYEMIAVKLNDYENHRTDTKYEDSLIGKTFLFQFINSFANMYYIAFVKPYIPTIDPCYPSCLQTLQTSLGTFYLFYFYTINYLLIYNTFSKFHLFIYSTLFINLLSIQLFMHRSTVYFSIYPSIYIYMLNHVSTSPSINLSIYLSHN